MSLARAEELTGLSRTILKRKFTALDLDGRWFVTQKALPPAFTNPTAKGGKNE